MDDKREKIIFLGLIATYIITGTVITISFESTCHISAASYSYYDRVHTFDHWFFMRLCMFLGQFACLAVHRFKQRRQGVQPEPEESIRIREETLQARRELLKAMEQEAKAGVIPSRMGRRREGAPGDENRERRDDDIMCNGVEGGQIQQVVDNAEDVRAKRKEIYRRDRANHAGGVRARKKVAVERPNTEGVTIVKQGNKKTFRKIVFLLIVLFDYSRTAFMFVALKQTYPTSWIMFQGIGVLSTCILTVAFVGKEKTVKKMQWTGGVLATIGMAGLGLDQFIYNKDTTYDPYGIAAGCLLYSMCGLVWAIQILLEQRYIKKHDIEPLHAVGLEGMYGSALTALLLLPYYFSEVGPFNSLPYTRLEDPIDAILQMIENPLALLPFFACIICVPFFYVSGITIMKSTTAVYRIGVELPVPVIAWSVFLMAGWRMFDCTQLGGFAGVVLGVFCYFVPTDPVENRLRRRWPWLPGLTKKKEADEGDGDADDDSERRPLLTPANPGLQSYVDPAKEAARCKPM